MSNEQAAGPAMRQKAPPGVLEQIKASRSAEQLKRHQLDAINNPAPSVPQANTVPLSDAVLAQQQAVIAKLRNGAKRRGDAKIKPRYAYAGRGNRLYIPMWVNAVYEHKRTQMLVADIVLVPLGDMFNGGKGIDHYLAKGYKHLEDVPEEVGNYENVRKHIDARNALIEAEMAKLRRQRELVELGVMERQKLERPESHINLYNWYKNYVVKD